MVYKAYNKTYDFKNFNRIRVFGGNIKNNFINMNMANDEQAIWWSILKNLKVRQNGKILT